jgi:hypothetical protein
MPRYTIKYKDRYMHFSGIADAPLTNFLIEEKFKEFYIEEYSEIDWLAFKSGKRNRMTLEEALDSYNCNLKEGRKISKEEFLKIYWE